MEKNKTFSDVTLFLFSLMLRKSLIIPKVTEKSIFVFYSFVSMFIVFIINI